MGSILPCCFPFGKAGELQILRCQGIAVVKYSFTLDALTLKPSDFCNVGVDAALMVKTSTQPPESARCCIGLRPGGELFSFVDIASKTGAFRFNDKTQQENKIGR
jgi:hypothetical protein